MSFLAPALLALSLLAVPLVLLYMLRLRRQEMPVSSTMLWRKLLRDREANAPWQRLRRNLLLILQLLILAALVLALARPYFPVTSVVSGTVVVLLDGSASMLATDVEPNRFSVAKEAVSKLIADLTGEDQMTLILVGRTPTVLASSSSDPAALWRALDSAQAKPNAADWPAALALAVGAARGHEEARLIVVSDGGLAGQIPPIPGDVVYIPVGVSGENLAISALATRQGEGGRELFASISNHGELDRQTLVSISFDGELFDSRRVTVVAGGNSDLSWDMPEGVTAVAARLSESEDDHLSLDDEAWAVHEGGLSSRTLVITEGNRFLETALAVLPGLELFRGPPEIDSATAEREAYDLYVFDGVSLPEPAPDADILVINPQPSTSQQTTGEQALIGVTGVFTETDVIRVVDSQLLQFVDWGDVNVRQAQAVDAPWAQPLVTAEGGPLLLAGERDGRRLAILTFRLQESDLPLQIAFPLLMANITTWLNPSRVLETSAMLTPGEPVSITPPAGTTAVAIERPDGTSWTEEVVEEPMLFSDTGQLGLYGVNIRDINGDRSGGAFAVNLYAPAESAIRPAQAIALGQVVSTDPGEADIGRRELWPWLAAAALVVLAGEWWVYHRGARLPAEFGRQSLSQRLGRR